MLLILPSMQRIRLEGYILDYPSSLVNYKLNEFNFDISIIK